MNRPFVMLVVAGLGLAACAPIDPPAGASPVPQRCDADASRSLIGTNVAAVSFAREANVRVVCTTCSATMDFQPDRLNVRFNQATGIIERVDCG